MTKKSDLQISLTFLGAAESVTGSKFLLDTDGHLLLLEAGMFQGLKELRERNWTKPPFDPSKLEAVILSHAHIDHSGYLPLLAREKFSGPVYCTSGTADLLKILLPDAAFLQEEEAAFANKKGYSKHKPALPLYSMRDADKALKLLTICPYSEPVVVARNGVSAVFRRAGHILGASTVELRFARKEGGVPFRLVFSGDLGRWNQPIIRDPELIQEADVLLIESTYGNRIHPADAVEKLAQIVNDAARKNGALIIPAFAIGRTQDIIWYLRKLEDEKKIPILPVYADSPMGINASSVYSEHQEEHDAAMNRLTDTMTGPLRSHNFHVMRTPEESMKLNHLKGPMIIISASGMATGGRVLHHLKLRLPKTETTVLLVGYQAAGTRGRSLQDGAEKIKIHGEEVPVHAKIEMLDGFSAHADQADIFHWLSGFKKPPKQTYVVHGEETSASALAELIRQRLHWKVEVPHYGQKVKLI